MVEGIILKEESDELGSKTGCVLICLLGIIYAFLIKKMVIMFRWVELGVYLKLSLLPPYYR